MDDQKSQTSPKHISWGGIVAVIPVLNIWICLRKFRLSVVNPVKDFKLYHPEVSTGGCVINSTLSTIPGYIRNFGPKFFSPLIFSNETI